MMNSRNGNRKNGDVFGVGGGSGSGGGGNGGGCGSFRKSPAPCNVTCSICLDPVADNGDRAWTKLKCGHFFHLDCIGSAFNSKGAMECPNCRTIEKGRWRYATGFLPNFGLDSINLDRDDDVFNPNYSRAAVETFFSNIFPPSLQFNMTPMVELNPLNVVRRLERENMNHRRSSILGQSSNSNRNNGTASLAHAPNPPVGGLDQYVQRPRTSRDRFAPSASAPPHPPTRRSNQRTSGSSYSRRRTWQPVRGGNADTTATTASDAAAVSLQNVDDDDVMVNLLMPGLEDPFPISTDTTATAAAASAPDVTNEELMEILLSAQQDSVPSNQPSNQRRAWQPPRRRNAETAATPAVDATPNQSYNGGRMRRPVRGRRNTQTAATTPRAAAATTPAGAIPRFGDVDDEILSLVMLERRDPSPQPNNRGGPQMRGRNQPSPQFSPCPPRFRGHASSSRHQRRR